MRKSWIEFPQKSRGKKVKTAPLKLSITILVCPLSRVVPLPNGLKGLSMGVTNHLLTGITNHLLTGMILQIGGGFKFKKKTWSSNISPICGMKITTHLNFLFLVVSGWWLTVHDDQHMINWEIAYNLQVLWREGSHGPIGWVVGLVRYNLQGKIQYDCETYHII